MNIQIKRGNKTEYGEDRIIIWRGKQISFLELLIIIKLFLENEERIYPTNKGYYGDRMLMDAIEYIRPYNGMRPVEALQKAKENGSYIRGLWLKSERMDKMNTMSLKSGVKK